MSHLFSRILFIICTIWLVSCGRADPSEDTDFLKAVRQSRIERMAELLTATPSLLTQTTAEHGLTPLHIAARYAKPEAIRLLIEQGAAVNAQDRDGQTPLHLAMRVLQTKDANRVLLLLNAGADPSIENAKGQDPWEYILAKTPFKLGEQASIAMGFLLRFGYEPSKLMDEEGKTVLHDLAERCQAPEAIDLLLSAHGFDPDVKDVNGWTPLHFAAFGSNYSAAEILLRHGADPNALTTQGVGERASSYDSEAPDAERRVYYKYPAGMTPEEVYKRRGSRGRVRSGKSLLQLFRTYQ